MKSAQVVELPTEQIAQGPDLRGDRRVGGAHAFGVVGLEDRVRQRLDRAVVDVLGQASALGLLGLDDAHRDVLARTRFVARRRPGSCRRAPGTATCARACARRARAGRGPNGAPRAPSPRLRPHRAATAAARRSRHRDRVDRAVRVAPVGGVRRAVPRSAGAGVRSMPSRSSRSSCQRSGLRRTPGDSARGPRASCSRCSPPPRWPPHGAPRSGCPERRSRAPAASIGFGV